MDTIHDCSVQVEELPRFDDGTINVTEPIRVAVHYLVDEVMDGLGVRGLRARQPEKRLQGAQTPHMRGRDRAQDPQAAGRQLLPGGPADPLAAHGQGPLPPR